MTTYEPLHHKYRPQTFADLVGQQAIADTLTNALNRQRIAPAYLFTGPRGTGKTSSARILAKSLNCLSSGQPTPHPCGQCEVCRAIALGSALDVIEIDAASNTGVDNIREIIERAQFAPVQCRYKVYVIDECHMLSVAAFNALLKTLEEPPERVIFVLATTDPQRVLPTIISRCQRFDYRRIPLSDMVTHLDQIAQKEAIEITPPALTLVAQIANGGLRDAESLLDQLSLLSDPITPEKVWDLVGAVPEQDLLKLLQAIQTDQAEQVLEHCRHLMNRGREPLVVLQNLAGFYLNLLIAKTAPHRPDLVAVTSPTWDALCQLSQTWPVETILGGQKHLKDSELQLKNTTQPRLWLEVTLLGLLPSAYVTRIEKPAQVSTPSPPKSQPSIAQTDNPPNLKPTPLPPVEVPQPAPQSGSLQDSSPSVPVPSNDLDSVWKAFLSYLPPFTASLMEQQAVLTDLQENKAYLSLKTEPLLRIAKNKLTEIETALGKVYQRPIKVHLQVLSHEVNGSLISPKITKNEPTSEIPTSVITPKQENKPQPAIATPVITSKPLPEKTLQPPPVTTSPVNNQDFNSVVENFAQLFEGEIITLSYPEDEINIKESQAEADHLQPPSTEPNLSVESHSPPKTISVIKGRPQKVETLDDEDIPF